MDDEGDIARYASSARRVAAERAGLQVENAGRVAGSAERFHELLQRVRRERGVGQRSTV